jgi:pimeloyl-ACP methyl ester carboxylesterase
MITAKHHLPELELINHSFQVPLDHQNPNGQRIEIFAREVRSSNRDSSGLPWLLFLQGGPGFSSPRVPDNHRKWWSRAVRDYRILLLDQRGTGLSTPVNHQTLAKLGSPDAQANYLKFFRADSLVRDAELIRKQLAGKDEKWSALGQSYGGFCCTTYLSLAPEGLREAIFTGGIPPLTRSIDEVYRATYKRVLDKNASYYERYPDDRGRAREIVDYLMRNEVRLPHGDRLSTQKFQQAGIVLGMSTGFEELHYLLEIAFVSGAKGKELNYAFLRGFENLTSFDTNPIYSLLHEPIYCERSAANWSAERVLHEYPQFDPVSNELVLFTGEMVYPWMFEQSPVLAPLKPAAEVLAKFADWPELYDLKTLQSNLVPSAAAVYYNDMYVERQFSEEAARNIRGIKLWVTSEYEHNGLRADGEKILDRLLKMLHDDV